MADPGPSDHHAHDPAPIVALLDRDLADPGRATAGAMIAACPACATLHDDLVALARATVALRAPARTRDFTLTSAVAASLAGTAAREPLPAWARLSHDMPETRSRHDVHDRLLIANLVDRAVDEAERAQAEELLAACSECEQLYDDLVALSAATRAMRIPSRPREFTLTQADAERLRIRGWRRLLGAIGSSRDVFTRPLALGLTTLGLAGLMVATVPSFFIAGGAATQSTPVESVGDSAAGAPPEAAQLAPGEPATGAGAGPAAAGSASAPSAAPDALPHPSDTTGTERIEDDQLFFGSETSPLPVEPDGRDLATVNESSDGPISRMTTTAVAGLLLAIGLVLFGLRWTARRLGDG